MFRGVLFTTGQHWSKQIGKFIINLPASGNGLLFYLVVLREPHKNILSQQNCFIKNTPRSSLWVPHIDCLVQDCSNSIANALELLQSCTMLSIYWLDLVDDQSVQIRLYPSSLRGHPVSWTALTRTITKTSLPNNTNLIYRSIVRNISTRNVVSHVNTSHGKGNWKPLLVYPNIFYIDQSYKHGSGLGARCKHYPMRWITVISISIFIKVYKVVLDSVSNLKFYLFN